MSAPPGRLMLAERLQFRIAPRRSPVRARLAPSDLFRANRLFGQGVTAYSPRTVIPTFYPTAGPVRWYVSDSGLQGLIAIAPTNNIGFRKYRIAGSLAGSPPRASKRRFGLPACPAPCEPHGERRASGGCDRIAARILGRPTTARISWNSLALCPSLRRSALGTGASDRWADHDGLCRRRYQATSGQRQRSTFGSRAEAVFTSSSSPRCPSTTTRSRLIRRSTQLLPTRMLPSSTSPSQSGSCGRRQSRLLAASGSNPRRACTRWMTAPEAQAWGTLAPRTSLRQLRLLRRAPEKS
jgi:hypothetical protein